MSTATPGGRNKRKGDTEAGDVTPKPPKKLRSVEVAAEVLKPFPISTHWVEHAYVRGLSESALTEMREEKLIVVHVLLGTGVGVGKVGGLSPKYDLRSVAGMAAFLEDELALFEPGLSVLENQAKGGAKYLVRISRREAGVGGMERLKGLVKLATGVGLRSFTLPLERTRVTVRATISGWPTWREETELEEGLTLHTFCDKATDLKRVFVGATKIDKVSFTLHLPKSAVEVSGDDVEMSSDLLLVRNWKMDLLVAGYQVTMHRTPSCTFCGDDSHVVTECELLQRVTSTRMPVFRYAASGPIPVESSVVPTPGPSTSTGGNGQAEGSKAKPATEKKKKKKRD